MSKQSETKPSQRNKTQLRAVILLVLFAVVAIFLTLFMSDNSYLGSTDHDQETIAGTDSHNYGNLQGEISRFFSGIKRSSWPGARKGKSILANNLGQRPLIEILDEKARLQDDPITLNWRGPVKVRWFMADDTLKSNSERLAAEENMELIWWLDKDYVVRAPFQVNADLLQSLDRLARSLNSHHPGSPQAFLCPRQRAILIATSESAESVSHYCTPASNLRSPTR
ncbi:TcpQ domain-containing protein [Aliidiomarina quisquiliarum]|uniref:TcpQ domain-containing protein n=1 Tax=Aliidiomarina quisquiliarum TaxID=2938947 RepID=UPI00208FAA35|nr:toxin co-regulated pilus biosynthesis Q family protein [Aliidiomarina quisquiliarum]